MFMVSAVDVIAQDNIAADIRNVFFMLRLSYDGCVVARMTHYIYHPGKYFHGSFLFDGYFGYYCFAVVKFYFLQIDAFGRVEYSGAGEVIEFY